MGNRSGLWELCLMLNPSVLSCDCKEFRVMFMIHIVKKESKTTQSVSIGRARQCGSPWSDRL